MTISPGPDPSAIPEPVDLRQDRPTPARMYDYFLGGKDNYAVDREAAERVKEAIPNTREIVWENRFFLQRAVRHLAAAGIDQFIDLGTGLPTQGNVHEIARQVTPSARVGYVDNDPIVLAHGRGLLVDSPSTTVITADMREPDTILANPDLRALIDLSRPTAVLLVAVLHFITDSENASRGCSYRRGLRRRHVAHSVPRSRSDCRILRRVYARTARLGPPLAMAARAD